MNFFNTSSLFASVTATLLLAGCATNVGKTPETAQYSKFHGIYWHKNPSYSVAKNAYSLAGVDVNFSETEVKPGSVDEAGISKYLINGTMGYVTGGLKGLSIMTLASLYSKDEAERLVMEHFVVFVPNPANLPFDDAKLVKDGARYAFTFVKDSGAKRGFVLDKQLKAIDECQISTSLMAKFDSCVLASTPSKDTAFGDRIFDYQAIRPAIGQELSQLNLPKGNYSLIRYTLIPTTMDESSKGFNGFILRPDNPKTSPRMPSVSINGQDYYLFSGKTGNKGFPEKTLVGTW
ncbi:hypothetical protein [Photorhabdus heterorhabditis]|uniref:hypothetical protein n=1 Tax=Photorhabdus heterorhabditis TaxID=880156 RepID=UPI0015627774|nr:hypothetical protein [Photorhabdus heterorhabditis]NRN28372.1 hypothetical protein [Photorhabdus heterorhabditis subsp. aluminescens]